MNSMKVHSGMTLSNVINSDTRKTIINSINEALRGINVNGDIVDQLIAGVYQADNVSLELRHLDGKTYTESVTDAVTYLARIIDNIPGTIDDADMRMAMVSIDGTRFNTLRERLEYDLKYCLALANPNQDGLMPKEYAAQFKYDEVAGKPAKIMEFNIAHHIAHSNAIPQSFAYSRGTGFWYIMQRIDNASYGSNLHVLQFDGTEPTGEWMDLKDTYHGSVFYVRTVSGVDHIFVTLNRDSNSNPTPAEVTWAAKTTKGWGDAGVKAVGHQNGRKAYVVVDELRNFAVVRYVGYHNNDEIQVWNYDEWYNGAGTMLYHFNINGAQYYPCQGFDANNGKLYWHSGTDANSNERVSVFDYAGKLLISRDLTSYNLIGSDTAQGKAEPEGLCSVTDDGGNPMVAFGHTCGPQFARRYILHAFNFESWLNEMIQVGGETNFRAKHAPVGLTSLSGLGPGWWYLTATQMRDEIIDKPQDFVVLKMAKSWYYAVLVEVIKGPSGYVYQHLMQLRPDHKRLMWNRMRYSSGWPDDSNLGSLGYQWIPDSGKVLLWQGSAKATGDKGVFFNHITHYDEFRIGYRNTSASNQTVKYQDVKVTKKANGDMATSTVPIHDINLPNKLGSQGNNFYWLYECNLHVVSDHFEIKEQLRISDASDWPAGIPNTTANKIEIVEVWGVVKNG